MPGPEHAEVVPARPPELVRDYVLHVGGDPGAYRGELPPHMLCQWLMMVGERTVRGLPYPIFKMLNGGCRIEVGGPLPADVPLRIAARLEGIDDNGRRVLLHQRVATGPLKQPELIVAHTYIVIPLRRGDEAGEKKERKEPVRVPPGARELAYWKLPADAGLAFAALTGDFNPVHFIPLYAKLFGHRSSILHGFATFGRAIEGLNRSLFAGDVHRIAVFDARFTRPLVLPAHVGLYIDGDQVFVGDAPCEPAYLAATLTTTTAAGANGAEEGD